MLWARGRIGMPIRVGLEIRLDPFLGVKLVSLYKERTHTSCGKQRELSIRVSPFYPYTCGPAAAIGEVGLLGFRVIRS
jgi:hypothetical protein